MLIQISRLQVPSLIYRRHLMHKLQFYTSAFNTFSSIAFFFCINFLAFILLIINASQNNARENPVPKIAHRCALKLGNALKYVNFNLAKAVCSGQLLLGILLFMAMLSEGISRSDSAQSNSIYLSSYFSAHASTKHLLDQWKILNFVQ